LKSNLILDTPVVTSQIKIEVLGCTGHCSMRSGLIVSQEVITGKCLPKPSVKGTVTLTEAPSFITLADDVLSIVPTDI
jgi:hypothetical protein